MARTDASRRATSPSSLESARHLGNAVIARGGRWLGRMATALFARVAPPRSKGRRHLERWLVQPVSNAGARAALRVREACCRDPAEKRETERRRNTRRDWMGLSGPHDRSSASLAPPLPRLLLVFHEAAGGVSRTTTDLLGRIHRDFECFLLIAKPHRVRLLRYGPRGLDPLGIWWLEQRWSHRRSHSPEHRAIYRAVLERLDPRVVHVRHLLGHTDDLIEVCDHHRVPLVLSLHDFYFVCPTVHLLDGEDRHCAGRCTVGSSQCRLPINWLDDLPVLRAGYLEQWRDRVRQMLPLVSTFVATSQHSRSLMMDVYPELRTVDFRLIEHGRDFDRQEHLAAAPSASDPVRILILGYIGYHKGADFIRRLKEHDARRGKRLQLHFLGTIDSSLSGLGTAHGPYRRDTISRQVAAIRPSFVGLFSTWPETYSHTLTEAWAMGIPVLTSGLGALGERVLTHGGGWILPLDDVSRAYEMILRIAQDPNEYGREAAQSRLDGIPGTHTMALAYEELYRNLIRNTETSKGRWQTNHETT